MHFPQTGLGTVLWIWLPDMMIVWFIKRKKQSRVVSINFQSSCHISSWKRLPSSKLWVFCLIYSTDGIYMFCSNRCWRGAVFVYFVDFFFFFWILDFGFWQMRFRVCPGFKVLHLISHSSCLCISISPNTRTHTHYKCRRQVAVLWLVPGFLPPGVSGVGDAWRAMVLQWLQGREETPLQTNCLGQAGKL